MKKLYRYIKFHLKTAAKNLTRNFGLAMSAAFSVTITLVLISVFLLVNENLNDITYRIEDQITIRANIDMIVKDKAALMKEVKQLDNVKKVTLSTGKEELEAYKKEYAKDNGLFDMYSGKTNPIQDTFIVEVKDAKKIAQTTTAMEGMKGITSADYGGSTTNSMIEIFTTIRNGSAIFIGFLILVAIFLISNKIKMSIYTRKSEIAIMRNVGASNWCIKFPMMLEGIVIGFMGTILPILITIIGYHYFYGLMQETLVSNMFHLRSVFPLTLDISYLLLGIGMLVGLVGSIFSTTRYLRWKR